jgi:nucleoside-diphosphate-sugar epimerase
MRRIILFGYGYTAQRLARVLAAEGVAVAATARSAESAAAIERDGFRPVRWTAAGLERDLVMTADAALISTPPGAAGCPTLAAAGDAFAARARDLRWVGYLSSNGVYGDHGGAVVDEDCELRARTPRARARVAAEAEWAAHAAEWAYPLAIFRLPGIYGPGRSALDAARQGRAQRVFKKGQVFNRMHVDDIAGALKKSFDRPDAGDLFNLADDEPAPPEAVVAFACELLGVPPPPLVPIEEADLSEMARSFYEDNKRIDNARMKSALGAQLRHPTYREGLRAILDLELSGAV